MAGGRLPGGPRIEHELYRQVEADGEAAVPWLVELVRDRALLAETAPGGGLAPIRAARLLGFLRQEAAIAEVVGLFADLDLEDPRRPSVVGAFRRFGASGTAFVVAFWRRLPFGEERFDLAWLLAWAGRRGAGVFDVLLAELEEHPVAGSLLLAEYGDDRALPYLEAAALALDEDPRHASASRKAARDLFRAMRYLGGRVSEACFDKLDRLKEAAERFQRAKTQAPHDASRRPGRNGPCHCGSGRKYKKCHLRVDERELLAARS